jgi:predicted PurR-regulated permease PerM
VFIVAIGFGFYSLSDPATEWIAKAPESFRNIEYKLRKLKKPVEEVTKVTEQAEQLTKIEKEKNPQTVEVKEQTYSEILLSQTRGLIIGIVLVITLLFFLLASGDLFLLKLVKLLPRLKDKKQAVEIARQTERDISSYLINANNNKYRSGFSDWISNVSVRDAKSDPLGCHGWFTKLYPLYWIFDRNSYCCNCFVNDF